MMRELLPIEILRTSYHEAGHAVMAHLCGRRVYRVEVLGDADHSGSVSSLSLGRDDEGVPAIRKRILCLLAGQVSESLRFGRAVDQDSNEDLDMAIRLALKIEPGPEDVMPALEQAKQEASRLLEDQWCTVEAMVRALIHRKILEGDELRRILARCSEPCGVSPYLVKLSRSDKMMS